MHQIQIVFLSCSKYSSISNANAMHFVTLFFISFYYLSMRSFIAQEVLLCRHESTDRLSINDNSEELIEDIAQLLRQCQSQLQESRSSVVMVYATAFALHSCRGNGSLLDTGSSLQHSQGRSHILLQNLQQSCRTWKFAQQVCDQLTARFHSN